MATERIQLETAAFGAIVLFLRTLWGWTQVELAKRCGTHETQISNWETGKVMPRATSVRKLAKALGVAESTLYDLQHALLTYVKDHPVAFDPLLRTSKALREAEEIREPRMPWGGEGRELIQGRWHELARDKAAVEERAVLLLRDTLLESLGGRRGGGDPE